MAGTYRLYGNDYSPYSLKVLAYFRYKGIPHEWLTNLRDDDYRKFARLPLVPLVITPESAGLQDSTPLIEHFETEYPDPPLHPSDPAAAFLSALLEEYGDEWGNKWMFHYRWTSEDDRIHSASRASGRKFKRGEGAGERMFERLYFVGSSPQTAEQIESSFQNTIALIDAHLERRPYLMGERPCFGDFGLAHQLYQASIDLSAGELIQSRTSNLGAWVKRMLDPRAEGEFEPLDALLPTLEPLLEQDVGRLFLPWSDANAKAIAAGQEEFRVDLAGRTWTQKPQKYHAKSLGVLRQRYADVADPSALDPILKRTGCLEWVR